ncbi:MAG TPA: SAVED domain-containing protein [Terriglobales bacterium]|nr:SAVED domain-containing protein [Terriglobales bacterium]
MANQVIPRLNGDDYQHLYSWFHVLSLLRPKDKVSRVRVEDADAGSVDDVTVYHEQNSGLAEEFYHFFYQVKYHEHHEHQYSTEKLFEKKDNRRSLLQKFFQTWRQLLEAHPGQRIQLYLVSNWSWTSSDPLAKCMNQLEGKLSEEFFIAGERSEIGKARESWRNHVGASVGDFNAFAHSLTFLLGSGPFREIEALAAERMEHLGLRSDANALAVAINIVREWIRTKQGDITIDVLERTLKERDLYAHASEERCVTVHMNTIGERMYDLDPDYTLDWRKYFEGQPGLKGHRLKNPANWNKKLLPELRSTLEEIRSATPCKLVRVRGLARLSAWFAFGFTFSEVAGYTIEVEQQDQHWRTDTAPAADFEVQSYGKDEALDGDDTVRSDATVACGISVTGDLEQDVRNHLRTLEADAVSRVLFLRPNRQLGRDCLRSAADAVALARGVKEHLRRFVKGSSATRVLLYYFGPLSGACFIGHQLNAVCREIQIMEDQQPGYAPAFLL